MTGRCGGDTVTGRSTDTSSNQSPCQSSTSTRTSSRSRRLEWYRQVPELHHRGESQRAIAGTLGLSRKTVRRMRSATTFPERVARPTHRNTDPYLTHLKRRWRDGCHNARVRVRELVERGCKGSEPAVRRTVAAWRVSSGTDSGAEANRHVSQSAMKRRPSSRQVSWLLFLPAGELDADERRLLDAIHRHAPPLVIAGELAGNFASSSRVDRASVCPIGSRVPAAFWLRRIFGVSRKDCVPTYRPWQPRISFLGVTAKSID
jgi:hypothetical protein